MSTAAGEAWWLAETKGEIRANTMLQREAAEREERFVPNQPPTGITILPTGIA